MQRKNFTNTVNYYFKRFRSQQPQISEPISPGTGMIVVIPCFNEPGLTDTFESLWQCKQPRCSVEIITVINSGEDAPDGCIEQNRQTHDDALKWISSRQSEKLKFHVLNITNLSKKNAGVGLARKTGMDEALYRFGRINFNGVIVCLDADCRVAENYLTAIEKNFSQHNAKAGIIYYEHDVSKETDEALIDGIVKYELSLRYYVQALRYSGYPYACQTVGSCMAVKAETYALAGGMNKRKAGEDFYFLHKIIPLGNFIEINNTCVYPSPRISDRVPFGTGKAMLEWIKKSERMARGKGRMLKEEFLTYSFSTFQDLKELIRSVDDLRNCRTRSQYDDITGKLPKTIITFLREENFYKNLTDMISETTKKTSFRKRFFSWLNGLKIIKFVHFARDGFYNRAPLGEACKTLLDDKDIGYSREANEFDLLKIFRELDKSSAQASLLSN